MGSGWEASVPGRAERIRAPSMRPSLLPTRSATPSALESKTLTSMMGKVFLRKVCVPEARGVTTGSLRSVKWAFLVSHPLRPAASVVESKAAPVTMASEE